MAARFRRENAGKSVGDVDPQDVYVRDSAAERNITAGILDQAVEEVFEKQQISGDRAEIIKQMLAADSSSAVAQAYYHSQITGATHAVIPFSQKPMLEVPYVLTETQVAILSAYAPDFTLRFFDGDNHDHPMAAACRLIDRKLVNSRIPKSMKISDVGGSVVPLILSGELGERLHTCAPVLDAKDPSRRTLAKLRAKMLSKDTSRSIKVREAAKSYLDQKVEAICNNPVQKCLYQTPAITSIHVYDVPLEDWAQVMANKNTSLLEGCMLFPQGIFELCKGEMPAAGARFECDAINNVFRMGFVDSPSWWYQHKLSDYLKYGVDQMLYTADKAYSYKVVERRGDTIFFRILQVACNAISTPRQYYRVPGVPMVRVDGFSLESKEDMSLFGRRKQYTFPATLWFDMIAQAKDMVERNTLSQERLFNYYRTVSPRQSINAVVISGGTTVDDLNQLLPLIVHVVFFALMEVARTKAEVKNVTDTLVRDRAWVVGSNWFKMGELFGETVKKTKGFFFFPFSLMAQAARSTLAAGMLSGDFDWGLRPEIVEVSVSTLLPHFYINDSSIIDNDVWVNDSVTFAPMDLVRAAKADPITAGLAVDYLGDSLPEHIVQQLCNVIDVAKEQEEGEQEEEVYFEASSDATQSGRFEKVVSEHAVSGVAQSDKTVFVTPFEVDRRRASIEEAIAECEAESAKSEAACADQYRLIMSTGEPSRRVLMERKEMFGNPEFWLIENGLIVSSFSGVSVDGFQHAAIYVPSTYEGQRLHRVREEEFSGVSEGTSVNRVHYTMEAEYSGWGYTNDSLLVYNGPAIVNTMRLAISKSMDFDVLLQQGPPGCGKTTSIVNAATAGDVILVPVRKAARETAVRWAKRGPIFRKAAKTQVKTVDSYLVNYKGNPLNRLQLENLLADEAFMTREGRWLAAAALLGVRRILAFGDRYQIPHVPRAECPKNYVSLKFAKSQDSYITYRCPPELVACWNSVYDYKVRSVSVLKGEVKQVEDTARLTVPSGCVMMGMYQADKKLLAEKYGNVGVPIQIMTVHESQGNTYEHVWLHRFDLRRREDNFSLYDKEPYVLVAMSRSTNSFIYVAPKSIGDLVTKWISKGEDVRRVNAAKDIESAGQSIEFC